jgi:hypothetical protein
VHISRQYYFHVSIHVTHETCTVFWTAAYIHVQSSDNSSLSCVFSAVKRTISCLNTTVYLSYKHSYMFRLKMGLQTQQTRGVITTYNMPCEIITNFYKKRAWKFKKKSTFWLHKHSLTASRVSSYVNGTTELNTGLYKKYLQSDVRPVVKKIIYTSPSFENACTSRISNVLNTYNWYIYIYINYKCIYMYIYTYIHCFSLFKDRWLAVWTDSAPST